MSDTLISTLRRSRLRTLVHAMAVVCLMFAIVQAELHIHVADAPDENCDVCIFGSSPVDGPAATPESFAVLAKQPFLKAAPALGDVPAVSTALPFARAPPVLILS